MTVVARLTLPHSIPLLNSSAGSVPPVGSVRTRRTSPKVTARTDIPWRYGIEAPVPYRQNKHVLFGLEEGRCSGCHSEFPFRVLEVGHVIPQRAGGQDNIENLQLLCAHCNRVKGDLPQDYLVARLREFGIAA